MLGDPAERPSSRHRVSFEEFRRRSAELLHHHTFLRKSRLSDHDGGNVSPCFADLVQFHDLHVTCRQHLFQTPRVSICGGNDGSLAVTNDDLRLMHHHEPSQLDDGHMQVYSDVPNLLRFLYAVPSERQGFEVGTGSCIVLERSFG